jgi:hypothetical protein
MDGRGFIQETGQFSPATGVDPRGNFIGPTASQFGCMSLKGENGVQRHDDLDRFTLNAGLMKTSEEIFPSRGREKKGMGELFL